MAEMDGVMDNIITNEEDKENNLNYSSGGWNNHIHGCRIYLK